MASKKFGDSTKLSQDKFSARAKKAVLRGDDKSSYAKGGSVKKPKGC